MVQCGNRYIKYPHWMLSVSQLQEAGSWVALDTL